MCYLDVVVVVAVCLFLGSHKTQGGLELTIELVAKDNLKLLTLPSYLYCLVCQLAIDGCYLNTHSRGQIYLFFYLCD